MSRKGLHRQKVPIRIPIGLRPRLPADRIRDLHLIHILHVDALLGGTADLNLLWEWMASVLTWSHVASACGIGEPEMDLVARLAVALAQRYEEAGRLVLSEEEKELVRQGSVVMDLLALEVDPATAESVAQSSRSTIERLRQPALASAC